MMVTQQQDRRGEWGFWGGWGLAFLGFPLGGLAGQALTGGVTTPLEGVLAGAATGAVIGGIQWLVLRRRLPLSPWWIVATAGGLAAGLGLAVALLGIDTTGGEPLLRGLVAGAGIGVAQALVLWPRTPWAALWAVVVAVGWALGWLITRAAGVDLTPNWSVFGATGAWGFQLLTGLALAWMLRRGAGR